MLKKNYEKPQAEYIAFYTNEEIASNQPLGGIHTFANDTDGNAGVSGDLGLGEVGGED